MKQSKKSNPYKWRDVLVPIISISMTARGILKSILRGAKSMNHDDKLIIGEKGNKQLPASTAAPPDEIKIPHRQPVVTSDTIPIWTAKIQELNGQANEYLRAITTGIWYYTAAVLVTVGWIFTSLKSLTELSTIFQFKELLSTYPNLCFPVLGLVLVNQIYVTICCSLGYLLFVCRLRLWWIHKQFINNGVFEPISYTKLAPFYTGLAASVFSVPFLISALILWRFPIWIEDITSSIVWLLQALYLALLIYFIIDIIALIWAILDLFTRFREEKRAS